MTKYGIFVFIIISILINPNVIAATRIISHTDIDNHSTINFETIDTVINKELTSVQIINITTSCNNEILIQHIRNTNKLTKTNFEKLSKDITLTWQIILDISGCNHYDVTTFNGPVSDEYLGGDEEVDESQLQIISTIIASTPCNNISVSGNLDKAVLLTSRNLTQAQKNVEFNWAITKILENHCK